MMNVTLQEIEQQIVTNKQRQLVVIDTEVLREMIESVRRDHSHASELEELRGEVRDLEDELAKAERILDKIRSIV